jgi:hypothetical protein
MPQAIHSPSLLKSINAQLRLRREHNPRIAHQDIYPPTPTLPQLLFQLLSGGLDMSNTRQIQAVEMDGAMAIV